MEERVLGVGTVRCRAEMMTPTTTTTRATAAYDTTPVLYRSRRLYFLSLNKTKTTGDHTGSDGGHAVCPAAHAHAHGRALGWKRLQRGAVRHAHSREQGAW